MLFFSLLAVLLVTTLAVVKLKERSLYILFLAAYTQNFVVSYLFTHGYVGLDVARALVLVKDILLLELFVWAVVSLSGRFGPPWPRPLKPLLLLTVYCILRYTIGVIFLDDDWVQGLYRLKIICFPLEILIVVMVLTALNPVFGKRFLSHMAYTLATLAVVALVILVWAPRDFWVDNANIAVVQADVKGDTENQQNFGVGLSLSGTMQGREIFAFISSFRAIGTFGEALALSFSMAVPVLLFSFYFKKSALSVISLIAASSALLFSLTRSAWIFCGVVGCYVLIRRHQYRPFLIAGCSIVLFFVLWAPMAEFAMDTVNHII